MKKSRILVVADDAAVRATLARWLMAAGYAVELAESRKRAREVVENTSVALAIVVPERLGAAGAELARELGGEVEQVIVIAERAEGAASGSAMPSLSEQAVLAKVTSALTVQPIEPQPAGPQVLRFEGYTLDAGGRTCVDANGQEVTLTRAEFSLLLALARQPGRVLSRDELSHAAAGRGAEPDDRSVDVLVSRLRRKIEPDPKTPRIIVTMPGEGYKFTAKPQAIDATASATAAPASPVVSVLAANEANVQGAKMPAAPAAYWPRAAVAAVIVLVLAGVLAGVGWEAWSSRTALQHAEAVPSRPDFAQADRRETVFKRMLAAMQDDRFQWRTVDRLAIETGVTEAEAHQILAEHPDKVVLGEARDGKLIARLSDR